MQRHKDCGEAGGFRDVDVAQDLPYRSEARSLSRKSRGMHENTPDGTDGSGSYCPDPDGLFLDHHFIKLRAAIFIDGRWNLPLRHAR